MNSWTKSWTTKYSLFSVWLFAREQTKGLQQKLGVSFEELIFVFSNGLATVYRKDNKVNNFAYRQALRSIKERGYTKRVSDKLKNIKHQFKKIEKTRKDKLLNLEFYKKFILLHQELPQYFLTALWSPNGLVNIDCGEDAKKKVIKIYEKSRKETEHLYPNTIENIVENIIKEIAIKEKRDKKSLSTILPDEYKVYLKKK